MAQTHKRSLWLIDKTWKDACWEKRGKFPIKLRCYSLTYREPRVRYVSYSWWLIHSSNCQISPGCLLRWQQHKSWNVTVVQWVSSTCYLSLWQRRILTLMWRRSNLTRDVVTGSQSFVVKPLFCLNLYLNHTQLWWVFVKYGIIWHDVMYMQFVMWFDDGDSIYCSQTNLVWQHTNIPEWSNNPKK